MPKTAHKKPGAKRGNPKPYKRPLDAGFPTRLKYAMARMRFINIDGSTANASLARVVNCERATIGQYLSGMKKTIDASLLLDLCDALSVTPYYLLRNEGTLEDVPQETLPMQEVRRKQPA